MTLPTKEQIDTDELQPTPEALKYCDMMFTVLEESEWLSYNYKMAQLIAIASANPVEIYRYCLMLGYMFGFLKGTQLAQEAMLKEMMEEK
jgi:hypothetical protein